ncbi:MAG: TonB-dependent receptor [Bacteroidales bacterium]|nr:TonB-dependent receptor [Bacteroidales bacterium]
MQRIGIAVVLMFGVVTTSLAQISLNEKNQSLRSVLKKIELSSKYQFFYNEGLDDLNKKSSIEVTNAPIETVLHQLFDGTNISFSFDKANKNLIVLVDKSKTEFKNTHKKFTGKVTDEKGVPIIGANIFVRGDKGTISDIDGNFSIETATNSKLEITYLGCISQTIILNPNRTSLRIVLQEDSKNLEEIVVIGYGSVKRKDITTAVSVVSTTDIEERPMTSAIQAIQGKAAGVQVVQPSGQPGAGLSIRVRGSTSVNADNEPLYVVDGIPTDNISHLSPNDIESMQILKDASSAAIYGARSANGVVLITTKRGTNGAALVKFSSYFGVSSLGKELKALNTEQYKKLMTELSASTTAIPTIPAEETRYTDWTKEFFKTGTNQSYQLSVSKGTDKLLYFISGGYMGEKGIVNKSNFNRYSFRTNLESQQTDWMKIGLNMSYTHNEGREVYENRSSMRAGSILSVINTPPFMQVWSPTDPTQYDEDAYGARIPNPMAANQADQTNIQDRMIGAMNMNITLYKGLNFKSNFGLDLTNTKHNYYLDPLSTVDGRNTKGIVQEGFAKNFEWILENLLTYDAQIENHNISLLGGSTIQNSKYEASQLAGIDLMPSYPNLHTASSANQITKNETWSTATEWALASFIGRASYNYDSRYLLTANVRSDGSSRFAPGKRWGIFPSVSAGWRISSEKFMEGTKEVINDLKIRAGWGMNGNQNGIGNYAYLAQYSATRVPPTTDNNLPGYAISQYSAANPNLTWEKTTQNNIGIDLSMFDSRILFTADAYYKKTTDLLLTVSLPSSSNLPGGITRNDGEMENKGLEFALTTHNLTGKFKWNSDFNISFNRNKLTKLGLSKVYFYAPMYETNQNAIILKEGLPLGSFYGYVSQGVDPETGNLIYADLNKNGITDPEDRTVIGNAQPKYIYGFTNSFSYKGFDLSIFLQGSEGNDIFNATRIDIEGMKDFRNQSVDVLRRWVRPGQETDMPKAGNVDNINNSTRFVEDGSYLRIKNVTLSYNFKSSFLRKYKIGKVQPYFTAQNIVTWTKYKGYDPEVNAYGNSATALGVDYGTYPQSKAFICGVNVEF